MVVHYTPRQKIFFFAEPVFYCSCWLIEKYSVVDKLLELLTRASIHEEQQFVNWSLELRLSCWDEELNLSDQIIADIWENLGHSAKGPLVSRKVLILYKNYVIHLEIWLL